MDDEARSHPRPPAARAPALLAAIAACALAGCGAPAGSVRAPAPAPDAGAQAARAAALRGRADAASDGLVARFWDAAAADFLQASPSTGEAAGYWISANALETLVDAAERTGDGRYLDVVRAFVSAQDRRGWTRGWFDDEAWMAVALLRAHDATGDAALLDRAAALVEDVFRAAPDGSCCGDTPGGLWWDRAHSQKATASNAVPVIAAARLFERTGDGRWLAEARDAYAFWRDHLVADDGQVVDHVLPSGERVWWRFSYDGGAMIGAALALHHATGDATYVDDARRLAAFLVAAQTRPTAAGAALFDGASCDGDCDAFKGIAHRYLAALADVADVPGLPALLAADAEAAWSSRAASGLFGVDWGAPGGAATSLAAQASAATALNVEAARAAAAPRQGAVDSAAMPIVHVHLRAGRTAAQKQAILDGVHAAFVDAFRLKPDDRFQLLHELPAEHFEAKYGPDTVLVEASVFQGRSADAKRRLFALVADHLERAGVRREAILVVVHEPPLESWGVRGGQSAADVTLGFEVKV